MADFLRYTNDTQVNNAKFIYQFFKDNGWTCESIAGMLGNMHAESGIIADIDERSGGGGYGLVQWTPKSKLVDWANKYNLNYQSLIAQCKRIQWELENGQQFYSTVAHPMTFKEFIRSTKDPTYLAMVFLHNYERPANLNQPQRGEFAAGWFEILVTSGILVFFIYLIKYLKMYFILFLVSLKNRKLGYVQIPLVLFALFNVFIFSVTSSSSIFTRGWFWMLYALINALYIMVIFDSETNIKTL